MKFRIDKLPKTEKDLEIIENEIRSMEKDTHHHHHEEDLIAEILTSLQAIQTKLENKSKEIDECRREVSKIYKILSKIIIANFSNDVNKKIKSLEEVAQILDE